MMDLGDPTNTLHDRLAIRDLIELYADRLTPCRWDGYEKPYRGFFSFTPRAGRHLQFRGRDEMMKLVKQAYASGFVHQMVHNVVVDRSRRTARDTGTPARHLDRFSWVALYYDAVGPHA